MKRPIYLDNHATTPVDPRVLEAMLPFFTERFGNAASRTHAFGWAAEEAVERARESVARLIGASARDIVWTSGATESNNLAIKGVAAAYREKGNHIVTIVTEHKAVLDPCHRLEREGFEVTFLPVDSGGLVTAEQVQTAVTERTILVSVMAANNEIGVLQPIAEIGRVCRERGVLFHTDAAQAAGKIPLDVEEMSIDLLSLSAHKMYGPKGVGALYARRARPRVRIEPLFDGGGHERGIRSGTLPVPSIVAFGKAAQVAIEEMDLEAARLGMLRERLLRLLGEGCGDLVVNGDLARRLPGNLNVSFPGVDSEALIAGLTDVAVSSGSACSSATLEPSHVLTALGLSSELSHGSIRFGLGRFTTEEEIEYAARRVSETVKRLRAQAPPRAEMACPS